MIDISSEALLTFSDAAASLPRRRAGRKTNVSTLYRWSEHGLRGVKLEIIFIGGSRCTSSQALQRFFDRILDSRTNRGSVGSVQTLTEDQRKLAAVKAGEALTKKLYPRSQRRKVSNGSI
jgi:hypothetical protein